MYIEKLATSHSAINTLWKDVHGDISGPVSRQVAT